MSATASPNLSVGSTSVILDAIRAAGTISRVGIAKVTGLTGATVSNVVRKLLDDGLVVEIGRAESTGGKPRVLLELNTTARYAVGVHLDHGSLTYALTNLAGAQVARMSKSGAGDSTPQEVVARMSSEIDLLIQSAGVDRNKVLGVGLVSPGPLSSKAGMHLTPPFMRSWEDYPLDTHLSEASGFPVLLDNDATASAIGEFWSGGTDREGTFATIYMSTGIGAGILIGGSPYRGASGNAGEIGHTSADINGPVCWCGMNGCVEAYAGPATVVAQAREIEDIRTAARLDTYSPTDNISQQFAAVARASLAGNANATALLEQSARYVAHAAHSLSNTLDLRMLVLTGSSFRAASHIYIPVIREVIDRTFFARSNHPVEVRLSLSAETAAAIGAAALVLQSELVPQRSSSLVRNVRTAGSVSELSTLSL